MPTMAKNKKKSGDEPQTQRSGASLNLYVDVDIKQLLTQYIEEFNERSEHRATVRSCVEAALKLYLKEKGYWPAKAPVQPNPLFEE